MTAQEWVAEFAGLLGVPTPDPTTFDRLLDIAAEAAHASERIAAPVACWLVGRADMGVDEALELAHRVAKDG